jgi:hypothetical protein
MPGGKRVQEQLLQKPRKAQKTKDGERYYVPGISGMGKTTAIKGIIRHEVALHNELCVYNVDTKKQGDFSERDGTVIQSEMAPDAFTTHGQRMVWQPIGGDDLKQYNKFYANILRAGIPALVNIDETANMNFNGKVPRELDLLMFQGRAFGISVIGGTQRVAQSPRELLSQASFIICFNLTNKYDKRSMIEALDLVDEKGEYVKSLDLKKYQLWFRDVGNGKPARKFNTYHDLLKILK